MVTTIAGSAAVVVSTDLAAAQAAVAVAADVVGVAIAVVAIPSLHSDTPYTSTPMCCIDVASRTVACLRIPVREVRAK